jgi:hypothetical protein
MSGEGAQQEARACEHNLVFRFLALALSLSKRRPLLEEGGGCFWRVEVLAYYQLICWGCGFARDV